MIRLLKAVGSFFSVACKFYFDVILTSQATYNFHLLFDTFFFV